VLSYSADAFRQMTPKLLLKKLGSLTREEQVQLLYDWEFWSRPEQRLPQGMWIVWLIMAGRGFGKTRAGAETVREWVKDFQYVNLVGATAADARDIMIEGESGIMAVCPNRERPVYMPGKSQLRWPNGAKSLVFSADEPERLRGKQHEKGWADEPGAWRYPEAWDQFMFGLRLGINPQVIATTTPRPTKFIKDLVKSPTTIVTRGTTHDNEINLAPTFLTKVVEKYQGTRLGRQELEGILLEDNPNALWKQADLDRDRVIMAPETLVRIAVGVDPAVTSNEDSDDTGIVAVGRDDSVPPHFYVFEDATLGASPDKWASAAVRVYDRRKADVIVGEVNNGGDLVEMAIRTAVVPSIAGGTLRGTNVKYKKVTATRGKALRAEPVAMLSEQGRLHIVGTLGKLEDELCDFDPTLPPGQQKSPNRMDAMVWAVTELMDEGTTGMFEFYRQEAAASKARKDNQPSDAHALGNR